VLNGPLRIDKQDLLLETLLKHQQSVPLRNLRLYFEARVHLQVFSRNPTSCALVESLWHGIAVHPSAARLNSPIVPEFLLFVKKAH
jgi:hypothetical protein